MTSYFERSRPQRGSSLRADVVEGDAFGVKGIAPPAFSLRGQPCVHEGDARRGHGVRWWWGVAARCVPSSARSCSVDFSLVVADAADQQRTGGEMLALGVERFLVI
jgi:hypothetical protein